MTDSMAINNQIQKKYSEYKKTHPGASKAEFLHSEEGSVFLEKIRETQIQDYQKSGGEVQTQELQSAQFFVEMLEEYGLSEDEIANSFSAIDTSNNGLGDGIIDKDELQAFIKKQLSSLDSARVAAAQAAGGAGGAGASSSDIANNSEPSSLSEINNNIESLKTAHQALTQANFGNGGDDRAAINSIEGLSDEQKTNLVNAAEAKSNAKANAKSMAEAISEQDEYAGEMAEHLVEAQAEVADVQETLVNIEAEKELCTQEQEQVSAQMTDIETSITSLTAEKDTHSTNAENLRSQAAAITIPEAVIDEETGEVTNQAEIDAAQAQIDELNAQAEQEEEQATALEAQIQEQEAQKEELQAQLDEFDTKLADFDKQIDEVNEQIELKEENANSIETELNEYAKQNNINLQEFNQAMDEYNSAVSEYNTIKTEAMAESREAIKAQKEKVKSLKDSETKTDWNVSDAMTQKLKEMGLSQEEIDILADNGIDPSEVDENGAAKYAFIKTPSGLHLYDTQTGRAVARTCPSKNEQAQKSIWGNNMDVVKFDEGKFVADESSSELDAYYVSAKNGEEDLIQDSLTGNLVSPLSFDLNGDGVKSSDKVIKFDIDGDGKMDEIYDSADGVLVFDKDGDGIYGEDGSEVFGNNTDLDNDGKSDGYKNGFEALKALALQEGLINGNDDNELDKDDLKLLEEQYGLMIKRNGYNSKAESLSSIGLTQINLAQTSKTTTDKDFDGKGNALMHQEGATFILDGEEKEYADLWHKILR